MTRRDLKIALAIGAAFIALNQFGLEHAPLPWMDEVILNDPARELAATGHFRSSVFGDRPIFRDKYLWHPPAQQLVTAAVYAVFGFGIRQTREPGIVFGGLAAAMIYFLAMEIAGRRRAAALAALLFALEPKIIQVARSGRMDMQSLCFAMLGAALFFRADKSDRARTLYAAAGLSIGLAGLAHPVASFWALALGLLLLIERKPGRIKNLIVFAIGAALPVMAWLAYALSDYHLFMKQFLFHSQEHLSSGAVLSRFAGELGRYTRELYPEALLVAAYVAALPWTVSTGKIDTRLKVRLLLPFIIVFSLNAIIMMKGGGYYYLYANVWLTLAAALMFDRFLPGQLLRPPARSGRIVVVLVVLLLTDLVAAGLIGRWVVWAGQWRARDPRPVQQEIARLIPPGSVVVGPPQAWYAVVESGSIMRLGKRPAPRLHQYFIRVPNSPVQAPAGSVLLGEVGKPLPPLFGRYAVSGYDYRMEVWKLPPPRPRGKPP